MQYRSDKYGNKISVLGYGCMRFSQKAGVIDIDKTEKEIMAAYHAGVNYFDTAYIYGGSEQALGKILERNKIRENISIATKLPHYLLKTVESAEKCFREQLSRLRTDYVDYYLMHMLSDIKTWERLKEAGIETWLQEKKKSGEIRQVGFSYHGSTDMFCQLVDAYDWDFCQIQYNYLDEHSQAGRKGLDYAAAKGIPVIIMEPLRGGRLANNLPEKAQKLFSDYEIKRSPAEWALRWLWNQPEVTCVLSGMNSMEMVQENVRSASESRIGEFTKKEEKLLSDVVKAIQEKMKVGCTGCGYCMPCPKKVDIPGTFAIYNKSYTDGWIKAFEEYLLCTVLRKDSTSASNCIECGKCEQHCPQGIAIRQELKMAKRRMEGPVYKISKWFVKTFLKY
ncbi:MAG: aldo/keto reductase [Lachnospiraceae bacterium]|nr:aldo/keto reductase [Lachnospiraceae bacterium]